MDSGQERTERATPKRRERARFEGDVARSALACVAIAVCCAAWTISAAPGFARWWIPTFAASATAAATAGRTQSADSDARLLSAVAAAVQPRLIVIEGWLTSAGAALAMAIVCGSLGSSPGALRIGFQKLSVTAGLRALISNETVSQSALALVAACAVAAGAVGALRTELAGEAAGLAWQAQPALARAVLSDFWRRAAAALAVVAAADVLLARNRHDARLRMAPREVREERESLEGKPEVKARRRSIAVRRSRSLRIGALRLATAVITNPSHVAVALRYAPPQIDVPIVISAGADLAAAVVRAAADFHAIPVVESPELARALFARVGVDEPIPEELYSAVAAVFAWIISTRGSLRGREEL